MGKKLIGIAVIAIMLFGVFGLVGCDNISLVDYKAEAKAEIANYATESNYCPDNWSIVCGIVDTGKAAVDAAKNKVGVDTAVTTAKVAIDEVEEKNMYNAVLYDKVSSSMKESFLSENKTNGAWDDSAEQHIQDETLPRTRVVMIQSLEDFNSAFNEFQIDVDFVTKMMVLYGETTSSAREFKLGTIKVDADILSIQIKEVQVTGSPQAPGGNIRPYTRWTMVVLDKLEVESIKINQ